MLVFAPKLDQDHEDLRRVIAGVNGVSVHSYRFRKSGMYDSELLELRAPTVPRGRLEAHGQHPRKGWWFRRN